MSNTAWYTGLMPRTGNGSVARIRWYKAAAYAEAMGMGQPMVMGTDGYVTPNTVASGSDQIVTSNNIGALAGWYIKGSVTAGIMVPIWDDPKQEFLIRNVTAGVATLSAAMALLGSRMYFTPAAGASVVDPVSGWFMGQITTAHAGGMLTVIGLDRVISNDPDSAYATYIVMYTSTGHVLGSPTSMIA